MLESVSCVGFVIHRIRRQLIEQRVKLESDMLMCHIECAIGAEREREREIKSIDIYISGGIFIEEKSVLEHFDIYSTLIQRN